MAEDGLAVTPNSELITLNSEAIASAGPRSSMVELLICNQRVGGSNPSVGSNPITPSLSSPALTYRVEWEALASTSAAH